MGVSSHPPLRAAFLTITLIVGPLSSAQEPVEPAPEPTVGVGAAVEGDQAIRPPEETGDAEPPTVEFPRHSADERSVILVQRTCETHSHREEVTLFANGTVRLRETLDPASGAVRQGSFGGPEMALGELPPDELAAWVDTVRGEDLGESGRHSAGPVGDMVARCRLLLDYDAMARWVGPLPAPDGDRSDWRPTGRKEIEYGGFDSFGLGFSRVMERVDSLATRVDPAAGRRTLPPRYEPAVGDVLRRADGLLFRVERATASPGGWELQGVDQPLTLYVMNDRFPSLFTELVRRR